MIARFYKNKKIILQRLDALISESTLKRFRLIEDDLNNKTIELDKKIELVNQEVDEFINDLNESKNKRLHEIFASVDDQTMRLELESVSSFPLKYRRDFIRRCRAIEADNLDNVQGIIDSINMELEDNARAEQARRDEEDRKEKKRKQAAAMFRDASDCQHCAKRYDCEAKFYLTQPCAAFKER